MFSKGGNVRSLPDSTCLSSEELFKYIKSEVDQSERIRIENHLSGCELCSGAHKGIVNYQNINKSQQDINELREIINTRSAQKFKFNNRFRSYLSAAALIIVIFSVLFLFDKDKGQTIFDNYFEPYPNVFPVLRSENINILVSAAFQNYDEKDYNQARELFDKAVKENYDARLVFYSGVSSLALGESVPAIRAFRIVIDDHDDYLKEQALYFLTLAYIKSNDFTNAKKILHQIVNTDGNYRVASQKLLKELE